MEQVLRVFISYAGRDYGWAEWIAWQLDEAGLTVELDCWDWQAGDNFVEKMSNAVARADIVVAVCSQAYYEPTRWSSEEWCAALRRAKEQPGFLVPVRVDDTPAPPLLASLIAPALYDKPADAARAALLAAIRPTGRPTRQPIYPGSAGAKSRPTRGDREPGSPTSFPTVWGRVPGRNEAFRGRNDILPHLHDRMCRSDRSVAQVLTGVGGVGKTQLATEYAWRFANNYDAVWWVHAEQSDRIIEQLADFAVSLQLAASDTPVGEAVDALRQYCYTRDGWLIVLDNATSAEEVRDWILAGPGRTLVTSRDPGCWSEVAAALDITMLARTDSISLLRAYLPVLPNQDADRLACALGDLPLALAQAAGLLAESGMPVAEYLELLHSSSDEILDEGATLWYPISLAAAIRISLERLESANQSAAQLLRLCAFMAPEPIPVQWLTSAEDVLDEPLASAARKPLEYRRCLKMVRSYGLARLEDDALTLHRLTQLVIRASVPPADRGRIATTTQLVLGGIHLGDTQDPANWQKWAAFLPHLLVFDLAATDDLAMANKACEASCYLGQRGEYRASFDLIFRLYNSWLNRLGPDHCQPRSAVPSLCSALHGVGRGQEALDLMRDYYHRNLQEYGEDHRASINSANCMAIELSLAGRREEARDLYREVLTRSQRVFGEDHDLTLTLTNNLAGLLRDDGEYHQAYELYKNVLTQYRRKYGADHQATLLGADMLAASLRELGDYEQARVIVEDALTRRQRIFGEDHPNTTRSLELLSAILMRMGEYESARELCERIVAYFQQSFGKDHLRTLFATRHLATCIRVAGDYDQARKIYENVLARCRRSLGDDHSETLDAASDLAFFLQSIGECEQAIALREEITSRRLRSLGPDHPATIASRKLLEPGE